MKWLGPAALTAAVLTVGTATVVITATSHGGQAGAVSCPTLKPKPSESRNAGLGSEAGSQPQPIKPFLSQSPVPLPTVFKGQLTLTRASDQQTVIVPAGTIIDVVLTNGPWQLPVASGGLSRLSAYETCNYEAHARFRAAHSGTITAELEAGDSGHQFHVTVLVGQ